MRASTVSCTRNASFAAPSAMVLSASRRLRHATASPQRFASVGARGRSLGVATPGDPGHPGALLSFVLPSARHASGRFRRRCRLRQCGPSCPIPYGLPLFDPCIARSRRLARFFGDGGAAISLASTTVPRCSIRPCSLRCALICAKIVRKYMRSIRAGR